jgi:hypothetical protein
VRRGREQAQQRFGAANIAGEQHRADSTARVSSGGLGEAALPCVEG